jgi:glycosyltransferase involved in cell wall biosynthesis
MKGKMKGGVDRIYPKLSFYKKKLHILTTLFPPWPFISVLMPVYNTKPEILRRSIESVLNQKKYLRWELCIVDDGSTDRNVINILEYYAQKSFRIKLVCKKTNEGIAATINKAAKMAKGKFIGVLDHDDELEPDTLFEYANFIVHHPDADCIYCDEDKIDKHGKFCDAWYKSDWNPDLALSFNYVMHFAVYRQRLFKKIGGVRKACEGSQDYDLLLRFSEITDKIYHISRILYHWRMGESSTALNPETKPAIFEKGLWALNDALRRRGISGVAIHAPDAWLGVYRVKRSLVNSVSCSIIVSYRGSDSGLFRLLESIRKNIKSFACEIIICPDSYYDMKNLNFINKYNNVKIIQGQASMSVPKAYNLGAKEATGDILFFVDDAIELVSKQSCTCLLEHIQRDEVGAVGGKVYYNNNLVEHAGVIFGPFNIMGYAHRATPDNPGYVGLKNMIGNYSAVMGLGMMTRKSVFDTMGGFDEKFESAYWDADYCLRLRDKKYFITYTPYAKLIHNIPVKLLEEMVIEPDASLFREKWQHMIDNDPFFNINFTRKLEDFTWEETHEN